MTQTRQQPQVNISNTTARSPLPVIHQVTTAQPQTRTQSFHPTQVTTTNKIIGTLGVSVGFFKGVKMPVAVDVNSVPIAPSASRSEGDLKRAITAGNQAR